MCGPRRPRSLGTLQRRQCCGKTYTGNLSLVNKRPGAIFHTGDEEKDTEYKVKNSKGKICLFQNYVLHLMVTGPDRH